MGLFGSKRSKADEEEIKDENTEEENDDDKEDELDEDAIRYFYNEEYIRIRINSYYFGEYDDFFKKFDEIEKRGYKLINICSDEDENYQAFFRKRKLEVE